MIATTNFQTVAEISEQHPDSWVLLANPTFEKGQVQGGIVLHHAEDKKDLIEAKQNLDIEQYKAITWTYTGIYPKEKKLWIGIHRRIKPE